MYRMLLLLCLCLGLLSNSFAADVSPLPAEQAFALSAKVVNSKQLQVEWRIAPGYFLYTKKIQIKFSPPVQDHMQLPQGDFHYTTNQERVEVYAGTLTVPISLETSASAINLQVQYQGCAAHGFCYPSITKNFMMDLAHGKVTETNFTQQTNSSSFWQEPTQIKNFLLNHSMGFVFLLFAGLGLLLALTPCVLPMFPILITMLAGNKKAQHTRQAFLLSLSYVLGIAAAYALIGFMAAYLGHSLQVWLQTPLFLSAVSIIFVALACSLFGWYELKLPSAFNNRMLAISNQRQAGTHLGVFCMGVLSTLIISPCVTAPLAGVLLYIAETGNLGLGASALFMLGLGMGIPLLMIGASAGRWRPKTGPWMIAVKHVLGWMMLAMAIWLLSRILPTYAISFLYGGLFIIIGTFFRLFWPKFLGGRRWLKRLGWGASLAGVWIMAVDTPLHFLQRHTPENSMFTIVANTQELDILLLKAKTSHQRVLLDFYADWCASCVEMDKKVFAAAEVRELLNNHLLLRIDLSATREMDENLLKRFKVMAPPSVLFFDSQGQELNEYRIVGEVNKNEFVARITDIRANQKG